ncbi:hypothetical protein NHQ30_002970 [Ciborinia camelliae]|nr:hypothetical protein NHQ30_002970 [Ciborinia camelliae]
MAQIDGHERFLVIRVGNRTIDSLQDSLESPMVQNAAGNSSLRDFTQQGHTKSYVIVHNLQGANIDVQMTENNNETRSQISGPARILRPKFSSTRNGRKKRRLYIEEEQRQIALGTLSNAEIPAAVAAARKEQKRNYRNQRKLLAARQGESSNCNKKSEAQPQFGSAMDTSSNGEDRRLKNRLRIASNFADGKYDSRKGYGDGLERSSWWG